MVDICFEERELGKKRRPQLVCCANKLISIIPTKRSFVKHFLTFILLIRP